MYCEVPRRSGETIEENLERQRAAWSAADDAFPQPQSYVDVPVDASYDSYFYENDGLRMLTRDEAMKEAAETNQDFDFSEAGQMDLWAVVVEMGVTPARCTVTSDLAAANAGELTVTVDHPIRVVHPTDEERGMYAIEWEESEAGAEKVEVVEA